MNKINRSGNIDFLKFLLAMVITIFHARVLVKVPKPLFPMGYFAVETFFIIAGIYLAKTAVEKNVTTFEYMVKKIKGFLPLHTICFIFAFLACSHLRGYLSWGQIELGRMIKLAFWSIPEYLLMPVLAGMQFNANINGVEWYLSAMLLAMVFIYPIVRHKPKAFCTLIAPMVFMMISGYLFMENNKSYNCSTIWNGFVDLGVLRAIASLSVGCSIYYFSKYYRMKSRTLATFAEIISWMLVFMFMNMKTETKYEFAAIYIMIFAVYISYSNRSHTAEFLKGSIFGFLGKLSFPMFLNQSWVRKVFKAYPPDAGYAGTVLAFVVAIIGISLVAMLIETSFSKWYAKNGHRIQIFEKKEAFDISEK